MIKGIGIDISKIQRFDKIIQTRYYLNFINKALSKEEIEEIQNLKTVEQKGKYLATRWAAKEALVKATGNKQIIFSKVWIKKEETG
jgi:holo-[acyl-carrier protein] synthase